MVSEFFVARRRIQALRNRPRGALFEGFAQALKQGGYVAQVARRHIRTAEHLIDWIDRRRLPLEEFDDLALARFARHIGQCRCPQFGPVKRATILPGAPVFLKYLRDVGITRMPEPTPVPREPVVLTAFCQWMRQEHGTSEMSSRSMDRSA